MPAQHFMSRRPGSRNLALPFWKRALDIACCIAALPVLALAIGCIGFVARVVSPGPILFRQERVGYLGRRFTLYKFRTMHVSADTTSHQAHVARLVKSKVPMQKLDARGDQRLFPGLDELPQILNILRGEMSMVGPRPCIPYECAQYSPWQRKRLESVPGLTGLWQVSGKNRTTFEEMIQLDILYSEQQSIGLDVWILLRTAPTLWSQMIETQRARNRAGNTKVGVGPTPSISLPR